MGKFVLVLGTLSCFLISCGNQEISESTKISLHSGSSMGEDKKTNPGTGGLLKEEYTTTCGKLSLDEQENCLVENAVLRAKISGSRDECKSLPSEKEQYRCRDILVVTEAEEKQDASLCGNIVQSGSREDCIKRSTRLTCAQKMGQEKEVCELMGAQKKQIEEGPMNCARVVDISMRLWCTQEVALREALSRHDASLCKGLSENFSYGGMHKNYRKECLGGM